MTGTIAYAELAERIRHAPPRLGTTRLVCVDGPAGSGKTTLADRLARAVGDAALLHLDDVYEGWAGLDGVAARVREQVLEPVQAGRRAAYRTWDWAHDRWGPDAYLDPPDVLVLEGCGAGDRLLTAYASLLIWVEAPSTLRLARGIARDGEAMRHQWLRWQQSEDRHFAREGTRQRADVHVDGTEGTPDAVMTADGQCPGAEERADTSDASSAACRRA